MRLKLDDKVVYVEESVIIVLFVCLLSNVARSYLSNYYICYLFIIFHEFSHMAIAALFGSNVKKINIKLCGLSINLAKRFYGIKAALIYIAGPLSNLLLAFMFYNIPIVFEINICLALVNLIPIKPLDGYNILNLISNSHIEKIISYVSEMMLLIIGILLMINFCNISIIFLLIYIKLEKLYTAKQVEYREFL